MKRKPANPGNPAPHASIQEAIGKALTEDGVLEDLSFDLDVLENIETDILDFSRCTFKRVQFAALHARRTHFTDCIFEQCDLSGFPLLNGTLTRAEFIDCRGTGASLDRLKMKDVLFRDCQLNYLTVSDCLLERVEFISCDLTHLMLFGSRQKELVLNGCRMHQAEISATSLSGVDLSRCELEGITAQGESLRGAAVSLSQAPFLLALFGIQVKL